MPSRPPRTPTAVPSDPSDPPYPSSAYSWYVVSLLMVVYVFSFIDRQILSLMIGDLKSGLNLSRDWHAGFLMGPAFAIFYTLFGIPFGRLTDSVSRRWIIAAGLGTWSLLTAGCGLARNFTQMVLMRVGVGIGEASLSPAAYSLISDYFPRDRLGRAIAFYAMGIQLGSGMAYMVGGHAIGLVRETAAWQLPLLGTIQPWQKVFLMVGLPGLLILPLLLLTVREPRRRGLLPGVRKGGSGGAGLPIRRVASFMRANWRTMTTHNLGFMLLAFSGLGTTAWLPEMFRRVHQWDADRFGFTYGAVIAVFGTIGTFGGGYLSDLLSRRGWEDAKIRVGFLASWLWFPAGILFPLVESARLSMFLVVFSVFFTAVPAALGPASIQEMVPNNMRGQVSAVFLFVVNIFGLGVGPLILALMTDYLFTEAGFGPAGIRYSLLTLTTGAHILSTLLLWRCMPHFRESKRRLGEMMAAAS